MIDGAFVVDAVVHGYNYTAPNRVDGPLAGAVAAMVYAGHQLFAPADGRFVLDEEAYGDNADPHRVAHALFAESQTDVAIYHEVPMFGVFADGSCPLWVGQEMRRRWPGRVAIYAGLSPWSPDARDRIDRLVEEDGVIGLKLYPLDIVDGRLRATRMHDEETLFPLLEHARSRGIRSIAVHKAVPFGPVPLEPFRVDDLDHAAAAFPDLTFEIVHGGFAFVEETALQLARFPNVAVNLESSSGYLVNQPRRFAEMLGTFLQVGGADRIVWATGCTFVHPRPLIEAFWQLEMPHDLVQDHGMPPLTREIKEAILGRNIARITGLDLDARRRQYDGDEFDAPELRDPWTGGESGHRQADPVTSAGAA